MYLSGEVFIESRFARDRQIAEIPDGQTICANIVILQRESVRLGSRLTTFSRDRWVDQMSRIIWHWLAVDVTSVGITSNRS